MNKKIIGSIAAIVAVAALTGVVVASNKTAYKKDNATAANSSASSAYGSTSSSSNSSKTSDQPVSSHETNHQQPASSLGGDTSQVSTTNKIDIKDMSFGPATITVRKGTQVTWTNQDAVPHNVTGQDGKGPHSQPLNKGDSYTYTFNEVGTFAYICTFHSGMAGKVVVVE